MRAKERRQRHEGGEGGARLQRQRSPRHGAPYSRAAVAPPSPLPPAGLLAAVVAARRGEAVAAAAHGLDRLERALGIELAPQAADEYLQHVGVAVEVLLVDVLGEIGLRHQLAGVQHEVPSTHYS